MTRTPYSYPARLEPDEEGRLVVHFPDLPEALTDGADVPEALTEASDCLSTALAARIVNDEDIPPPRRLRPGQYLVAPDPTMALKAALYSALRARNITAADLARQLRIDERKATRLIDPRASSSLTNLEAALSALGYVIRIEVHEKPAA
jgi:antitoxin HicB